MTKNITQRNPISCSREEKNPSLQIMKIHSYVLTFLLTDEYILSYILNEGL